MLVDRKLELTGMVNQKEEELALRHLTSETAKVVNTSQLLNNNGNKNKKGRTFLYFSLLTADLLLFDCGCNFTWTSPAMSTLRSSNLDVNPLGNPITTVEEAWIAACANLGGVFGPLLFGSFPDKLGRKKTLIMIAVFKILCYLILAFAQNIYFFCLARLLLGMGMGMTFAVMPMYTGEISEAHNRGKFGALLAVYVALGMLYTLTVGPLLRLKTFTLLCATILMIPLTGLLLFIPESPVYLISIADKCAAKETIMKLHNTDSESANNYLRGLVKMAEEGRSNESKILEIFKTRVLRKALIIGLWLYSLQQLSGMFPIVAFIAPIFEISGSEISPYLSSILVSLVQLTVTILSSLIVEKVGRKPLLISSTIGIFISLLSLGFYFYLKESESYYAETLFWLPVTSLIVYMISISIGLMPIPMAVLSELFPSNFRATASSFVCFFAAFVDFVVTFIFPILMKYLGSAKCFWIFSVFSALGTIFIYVVIPETKGKSISEIQNILGGIKGQG